MNNYKKIIIKIIVLYLIISSMYIGVCINFQEPIYYENYVESNNTHNIFRLLMGLPKTINGNDSVSPLYIIEIIIKVLIAICLIILLKKQNSAYIKTHNNNYIEKEEKKLLNISTIIIYIPFIIAYLIYLYITFCNIHSNR